MPWSAGSPAPHRPAPSPPSDRRTRRPSKTLPRPTQRAQTRSGRARTSGRDAEHRQVTPGAFWRRSQRHGTRRLAATGGSSCPAPGAGLTAAPRHGRASDRPRDQRSLNDARDPAGQRPPPGRCPRCIRADCSDFLVVPPLHASACWTSGSPTDDMHRRRRLSWPFHRPTRRRAAPAIGLNRASRMPRT